LQCGGVETVGQEVPARPATPCQKKSVTDLEKIAQPACEL